MGPVVTPAIVLHAFPYSETSKIVRLATRDFGVQSAIAKGARRTRSAVGARLQLFSEGQAHLYLREHRDLHALSGFDVERERLELAGELQRFVAASALAELELRCAPPATPLPGSYDVLRRHLDLLAHASTDTLEAVALRALWHLVRALGFAPSLDACARDGAPLPEQGRVAFSVVDGGGLCTRCASGRDATWLDPADFAALSLLASGSEQLPSLPSRHATAHRRLLGRFVRQHLAEGRALEALSLWETRPWTGTSS